MSKPGPSRTRRIEQRKAQRARRDGPAAMPIPEPIRDLTQQQTKEHDHAER